MNATRARRPLAFVSCLLLVGCGKTTSDVDSTGKADSPRGGTGRDAGGAVPRADDDGARGDDARADGGTPAGNAR